MLLPRRSLVLKTLVVVFLAALCLWLISPPHRSINIGQNKVATSPQPKAEAPDDSQPVPVASAEEDTKASDLATFTFATLWGREKDPALAAFSKWAAQYADASPAEQSQMVEQGIGLACERRVAFKNLIRTQPKTALAETVPAILRGQLPASVISQLEERVTGQGDLHVLGRTDARGVQAIAHRTVINGREYEAYVYGDRASQRTRSNISLHGVALDGEIALSESPLRVFEPGEVVPAEKPLAADSCPVSRQPTAPTKDGPRPNAVAAESGTRVYWMCHGKHVRAAADQVNAEEFQFPFEAYASAGVRSALVMLVDFPDLPGGPATPAAVDDTMNAIDSFLSQNSFGDLHLSSHTTTPVLHLARTKGVYNGPNGDSLLLSDARNAARTNGFNPDTFDFDIVAFADIDLPWSGQGYIGSKGAWIQGAFAAGVLGHELGHNLGLWHANSWNSTESSISPEGVHEEYGNPFDVMGRSTAGFPNNHYSANFKHLLGWLSPANIAVVNASGTFRVYAHDQNSRVNGRLYGLNIPVGIVAGDETEDYWIDFRQLFASIYPPTANGAIIQWGNDAGTKSASRLIDMNFSTTTKADSPLVIGDTFKDADRGLEIKPLAQGGSGADAYLDVQVTLVAPPIVDLADAVDNTEFSWATSAAGWSGQRSVTHDGVDAAGSAPIRDSSETYLETSVEGPGALFFWWKVSSEENFDFLKLIIDGQEITSISGQVDWEQRGYELAAGPHSIRWLYQKDGGSAGGADRGWIDEVGFVTGPHAPYINSQPAPATVGLGDTAQLHIDAIGSGPLFYQWQKLDEFGQAIAISGGTNATLAIADVQNEDAGQYSCVISNSAGTVTSSYALLTVVRVVSLADAVDNAEAAWATSGAIGWSGQQAFTHDGSDAAQSGPISNGKDSSLTATITGPGTLTFWWKVSSEVDYDLLSLYMDGDLVEYHSGDFDWAQKSVTIPNGVHNVRWTYAKDANLSEGLDSAWVDQVSFTPLGSAAPIFISEPAPQAVSIGGTALFTARYSASNPISFIWMKDGVTLQAKPNLIGLGTDTLCVTNVQGADAGTYSLRIVNNVDAVTSAGASLTIVGRSLADAVDQPNMAFLSGGQLGWTPQTAITHDMIDAARTGAIADEQLTWIETRVQGPANVAFWWKISSEEDYDFAIFELDTVGILKLSGEIGWRRENISLEAGQHVLRWKYRKDRNTPGGDDAVWLDQLEITPSAQPQITNFKLDGPNVTATVQTLPASGMAVLECSTNLGDWTPLTTNQISGGTVNILRPTTNNAQFLRIRLQ